MSAIIIFTLQVSCIAYVRSQIANSFVCVRAARITINNIFLY